MNEVPFCHPWNETRIGDVADVIVGGTPSTSVDRYWGGSVRWMASGDVHQKRIVDVLGRISHEGLNASNAKVVEPPAVAIALAGQGKTRGTAAIVLVPLCTNQSVALIKPRGPRLDVAYLYHCFEFRYEELRSRSAGAGRAGLSKGLIEAIPVPLPEEHVQRKIAEVLDNIDRVIGQGESLIAKYLRVKIGLMQDLLRHGIDEDGQIRHHNTHEFRKSHIGLMPTEWEALTLGSVASSAVDGPFGSNLKTEHYVEGGGVRVVRLQNIGVGKFEDADKVFVSNEHAIRLRRHRVQGGDLLVAALGDERHPLARACLYPLEHPDGIVKADCFRFRLVPERASHGYVSNVLNSEIVRPQVEAMAQGVTRERVNLTKVRGIVIGLPPKKEQEEILTILDAQDLLITTQERQLSKFRRLKTALMQDLLTGRVSVEPLLETGVAASQT